ncbi:MAG: hypothetical protein ACR2QV_02815 [Gammaproteobacteria bacterium]
MKAVYPTFALLLTLMLTPPAMAQRFALDDSLSPRQVYDLDLGWGPQEIMRSVNALLTDQDPSLPPITGYLPGVDIRLDTRAYVGKTVRIYLRLPTTMPGADSVGDIELSWRANDLLLDGSVSPGQEALLFEGTVDGPVTGGVLNFSIAIGAGGVRQRFNLEPIYEIEIIS